MRRIEYFLVALELLVATVLATGASSQSPHTNQGHATLHPPFKRMWSFGAKDRPNDYLVVNKRLFYLTSAAYGAVHLETGRKLWEKALSNVGYSTSSEVGLLDDTVLFTTCEGDLLALRASDGSKKWHRSLSRAQEPDLSSPSVHGRIVLVVADRCVFAYDANGTKRWEYDGKEDLHGPTIQVINDRLLLLEGGRFYAYTMCAPVGVPTASEAKKENKPLALPVLLNLLKTDVPYGYEQHPATRQALDVVTHSHDPQAVAYLIAQLADPKAEPEIRHEAYLHLAETGGEAGLRAVLAARSTNRTLPSFETFMNLDALGLTPRCVRMDARRVAPLAAK